jgi:D-inositol-3-phosphate glycosyltransferase
MPAPSPKHVALVGPLYPYRGGIVHFLETMYHGLRARGHAVSAVTFKRQYPELLFPGKTQYEAKPPAHPIPAPRLLDTVNPLTWRATARHLARQRPDAVVFKYWMPFFAPAFGTVARHLRRRGIRIYAVVDNAIPHERRPGDLALSRSFLRSVDGCIVMSESVERDLERLGVAAPVRRIAHPIYDLFGAGMPRAEARALLGLPAGAPVLLFFGFIRRYKGLHALLDAMPRIVRALPDVRLVVAGEFYEDAAPYRAKIDAHGLQEHVRLCSDYIPNEEVPRYFSAADVVVQPYVSATQSGVAQIAYQFDRPLVVTDVGGLAEVVPHERAGLVVPPEDPEALAVAVIRFFEEGLAERLTAGVREEKTKYSWDRLYEALEDLMQASER